jgi:hypothetical protein
MGTVGEGTGTIPPLHPSNVSDAPAGSRSLNDPAGLPPVNSRTEAQQRAEAARKRDAEKPSSPSGEGDGSEVPGDDPPE